MHYLSLRVRGLSALLLLVFFPVFVLLLIAVVIAICVWLGMRGISGAAYPLALLIPVILALGTAIWDVIAARRPKPLLGHELTESEHPALWAELDWLAEAMNQRRPDRIAVQPRVNASVTTAAKRRQVMIGYPLLAGLSRHQLRAVLAHEMGHLAHGHTRTGWLSYRASQLLERTVARLNGGQIRRLIVAYYQLYLLISISVLRDYERQADQWSARLAGGPGAASVFPEMARLEFVWDLLGSRYLPLAAEVDARPSLSEAIHGLTEGRAAEIDEAVARHLNRLPSRWSTHPSDTERIRQLETEPDLKPSPDGDQPAWQLLGQQPGQSEPDVASAALLEIEASLLPPDATPASWQQVVHRAGLRFARRDLCLALAPRVGQAPDPQVTLRGLLENLSTESGGNLAAPLVSDRLPRGYWHGALNLAIARTARSALLITLADQGRARMGLRWNGPSKLEYLTATGEVQPWPEELTLTGPLEPTQVTRALDRLVGDGIDVDIPLVTETPLLASQVPRRAAESDWLI